MRKTLLGGVLLAALIGCTTPPQPGPTPTQAPAATGTPAVAASATPTPAVSASATPAATATPTASTDISSEEGISTLRELIDKQVQEKVLQAKEVEIDGESHVVWSGTEGIRRIDVSKGQGTPENESAQYYYQDKHLFSFGGSGTRAGEGGKEERYTFWAGISSDEKLVGPPFQFVGGKAAPYPEDDVREREDLGIKLHQKYSASDAQ